MEPSFPTIDALNDIESRQDEVLRKLEELEKRIAESLAQFGDQKFIKTVEFAGRNSAERLAKAA